MTLRLLAALALILAWLALCLWAWRNARARAAAFAPAAQDEVLVAHASQTGMAHDIAQRTASLLHGAGIAARLVPLGRIEPAALAGADSALFVVSTYGEGDPPDEAAAFADAMPLLGAGSLARLRYAVLTLGDSGYRQFCGFGRRLDDWLRHCGAQPLFDRVEVDRGDPAALRRWQGQLGALTDHAAQRGRDVPDWEAPDYQPWTLARRERVNPGSQGEPCFHLELTPPPGTRPEWQAGDLVEIGPRARRGGELLAHREYSIASLPADGAVHLLVRQQRRPDGTLGAGSGWLTQIAQPGDVIDLRLRANRNFHAPPDDRPLILIGNGTGLAGLRALIKAREAAGHRRNWLIFGERNAAHDTFYRADIARWRDAGVLARMDLVFSRDQAERRYVQHILAEAAEALRAWVGQGAALYVCGSLQGMAAGVDGTLRDILGEAALETLRREGRYRRDVY